MRLRVATAVLVLLTATRLSAAEVLLKNSWISTFKNRVTMALTYKPEKAHKKPNPVGEKSDDGDMHLAKRRSIEYTPSKPMTIAVNGKRVSVTR